MDGDSLAISETAAARDPTAEEFVISIRRAGQNEEHAQNTVTAPAGSLARARFNRVLVPSDGAGNFLSCERCCGDTSFGNLCEPRRNGAD